MIELRLLGSVDLKGPEGTLRSVLAQPKRVALLAYLAVARPNGFHRRDKLLGLFWPESDQVRGRGALRKALYFLRQSLADDVIVSRGDEEVGLAEGALWCDAVAFEEALEAGQPEEALELYRGDLLEGFYIAEAPEFERWLESERARLADRHEAALESLAEMAEASGDHRGAVTWWKRLSALDPYNSRYMLRLIQALASVGDRGNALQLAQEHERRLSEELGMEPDAELLALAERLRRDSGHEGEPLRQEVLTAAAAEKSASEGAPMRWLTWRKTLGMGALAVAAAVAVVAVVRGTGGPDTGEVLNPNRVAVFPFTVRGTDELAYLREGMVDLMSTALDGAGELRAVDPHALLSLVERTEPVTGLEQAGQVARHFGAGLYVLGSIVAAGDWIQMSAALYDLEGSVVQQAETRIDDDSQLIEVVDGLSRQLLAAGVGGPGTRHSRLAALTTQSLPALKGYLQGENAYRTGQLDSAVAAYRRAVAADSTFALGYFRLAVASDLAFVYPINARAAIRGALPYKDRLANRDRALVEAYDAYLRGAAAEAERRLRSIVGTYPSDIDAWHALGRVLRRHRPILVRPFALQRAAFERVLELDPDHVQAHVGLYNVAVMEGRFDEAEALMTRRQELAPDADLALALRAGLAYARDDTAEQEQVLSELRRADNVLVYQAFNVVAKLADDRRGAIEVASLLTDPSRTPTIRAAAHSEMAHMEMAIGRWAAAKDALDWVEPSEVNPRVSALATQAALAVSLFLPVPSHELEELRSSLVQLDIPSTCPSTSAFSPCPAIWGRVSRPYLAGLLSARLADYDGAEKHARELEVFAAAPDTGQLMAEWAALAQDRALSVRAHAAWKAGRSRQALALIEEMEPERWWGALGDFFLLRSRALERYLMAELLRELGRDEEALTWYESLTGRVLLQVYLAPTHFRRAEIHERLGNREEAARHYHRVIEIWEDCDPELRPIVERAEQRLARLASESR